MKFLIALAALLIAGPVFAGSPFLPIDANNTFKSGERQIMEDAIARAEVSGKILLVDMAAAWCGPCLNLEKQMEEQKEELAPTLAHFEYVKLEEMHLEFLSGADFIAHEIPWFPSLYVYNPSNQKWTFLYATTAPELKSMLDTYLAHDSLSGFYVSELNAAIARGDKIEFDPIFTALFPLSVEDSGEAVLAETKLISDAIAANPAQFNFPVTDLYSAFEDVYLRSIEQGKLTLAQIQAADPNAFPDLVSTAGLVHQIYFRAQIGNLIRKQGNRAASAQCESINSTAAAAMSAFTEAEQRQFAISRGFQCLMLRVQLGEALGADIDAYAATLSEAERATFALSLAKNYALTGHDFDKAATNALIWKAVYEKNYAKYAELLARIQVATDQRLAAYAAGKSHP